MGKSTKAAKEEKQLAVASKAEKESTGFVALDSAEGHDEAMLANVIGDDKIRFSDIPMVKVPSGSTTQWVIEDLGETTTKDAIEGLVVLWEPYGVLWGSTEQSEGDMPLLVTSDLETAVRVSDDYGDIPPEVIEAAANDDGTYRWKDLVYNRWGTGKHGNIKQSDIDACRQKDGSYDWSKLPEGDGGKRCTEQRYLGILGEEDPIPMIVRIPPTSIGGVSAFFRRLGIRSIPFWQVRVRLTLTKEKSRNGQAYGQVQIAKCGDLVPRDVGKKAYSFFTEPLKKAVDSNNRQAAESRSVEDDLS